MTNKYVDDDFEISRDPSLYYKFLALGKSVTKEQLGALELIKNDIKRDMEVLRAKEEKLSAASANFMEENKFAMKTKQSAFSSLEKIDDQYQEYHDAHLNFIVLLAQIMKGTLRAYEEIYSAAKRLKPPSVMTMSATAREPKNFTELQALVQEIQLNGRVLENYMRSIAFIKLNENVAANLGGQMYGVLEQYYKMLLHRHTVQGVKIFKDPVITDVAMKIFENIDSHGELESGKKKDQISAYTIRKAEALTKAIKDDLVNEFLSTPDKFIEFIGDVLRDIELNIIKLNELFKPQIERLHEGAGSLPHFDSSLKETLAAIKDTDPANISYAEPKNIKTEAEKFMEEIKNETLEKIVEMILDKTKFDKIVDYVLERKAYLKKYFNDENSFYVCKIGEGNPFLGQAPGALYVTPAERPRGQMKDILGSGFDEVREFVDSIESSAKYHSLFMATSPSKSADKSNILLIGPMGCGKTEIMRAVAADKKSIGVFAQGSDFQTCWKGEAEKNPKRMFEEGIKLNKESGKHVHFLIDEIDAVLNSDRDVSGNNNLTLEFQILMDGVVSYPNLSIWGATNNPERIPMPMLRRFNKVLIVGELNDKDRLHLLKHFMNHMPISQIEDARWLEWSKSLEGATGDVMRKIADYIWRKKMNQFVKGSPEKAENMAKFLEANSPNGQFSVDKFDRELFKKELSKYMTVTSQDIEISVKENLNNLAVRAEISTAKAVYERAKKLLNNINKVAEVEETAVPAEK